MLAIYSLENFIIFFIDFCVYVSKKVQVII